MLLIWVSFARNHGFADECCARVTRRLNRAPGRDIDHAQRVLFLATRRLAILIVDNRRLQQS